LNDKQQAELRQKAEATVMYHCREISQTIDALQEEWDKLMVEEASLEQMSDAGVRMRIEDEKGLVIDAVDEALSAME
jgi:hypothetical protein